MVYVPGTAETDNKKQNRSLQAIGAAVTSLQALGSSNIMASLGADVLLNNASNYFDGPSVAQGTTGTWFASGTVTLVDTGGATLIYGKLWDGTTLIASGKVTVPAAGNIVTMSLSGCLSSPAGNIRISCLDNLTTGKILFNGSGNSKDSTISAYRIA